MEPQELSNGRSGRASLAGQLGAGLLVALAAGVLVAGCGGDDDGSDAAGPGGTLAPVQSGEVQVQAIDNVFRPEQATVVAGSEIVWTNQGRNDHNIIPVGDTPFRVDVNEFKPGDEYRVTLDEPGTYRYYCSIHGSEDKGMVGTVQVVEG